MDQCAPVTSYWTWVTPGEAPASRSWIPETVPLLDGVRTVVVGDGSSALDA
jgi:hypothetical protein